MNRLNLNQSLKAKLAILYLALVFSCFTKIQAQDTAYISKENVAHLYVDILGALYVDYVSAAMYNINMGYRFNNNYALGFETFGYHATKKIKTYGIQFKYTLKKQLLFKIQGGFIQKYDTQGFETNDIFSYQKQGSRKYYIGGFFGLRFGKHIVLGVQHYNFGKQFFEVEHKTLNIPNFGTTTIHNLGKPITTYLLGLSFQIYDD
jgi:hypothetical protein